MRLFNSPFTKTGEVKYFELFKIFVLVMGVVMSFSFFSNQIEVANYLVVKIAISALMMLITILFSTLLIIETNDMFVLLKSIFAPLFINFRNELRLSITEIFSTLSYYLYNIIKPRSQFSRLCVMRC